MSEEKTVATSILAADPRGRMDVAALRLAEHFVKKSLEPALGNRALWDRGLGEVVERLVVERSGIPSRQMGPVEIARYLGILPAAPRIKEGKSRINGGGSRIKGGPQGVR